MLIWKLVIFSFMIEEIPNVKGILQRNHTYVADSKMIHELELKGYGEQEDDGFVLKSFESLYLLYQERLYIRKGRKHVNFDEFMRLCQKEDPDILTKFLIYRDLRNRGYVVKDGFGFGSDFRVYERGQFGVKGAKFLIFGLSEGRQEKMGAMQKKIEQITKMGKEPIIAVIERRGEVIYYRINKMDFYENKTTQDEPFSI